MKRHGPSPTIREMFGHANWLWLDCNHCSYRRPVLLVHLAIALGLDASSDRVRSLALCPHCGKRGAQTYMPSHGNTITGTAPFPRDEAVGDASID